MPFWGAGELAGAASHPVRPDQEGAPASEGADEDAGGVSEGEGSESRGAEATEVGEQEQALEPKVARDPGQPSARKIAEHAVTHLPYRSWCPHCVRGLGRNAMHRHTAKETRSIPLVAVDYCFMGCGEEGESPVMV